MDATLYLCATSRLAQRLRKQPPDPAVMVWQPPRALTPAQWLGDWAETQMLSGELSLPVPLSPLAEQCLWEQVISGQLQAAAAPLFDVAGMARAAMEAHALMQTWSIDLPVSDALPEESRQFLAWRQQFQQRCRTLNVLDGTAWQWRVQAALAKHPASLPAKVYWCGFDRFTPFEQALSASLARAGVKVENRPNPAVDRDVPRVWVADDAEAECRAAVAWAQIELQREPSASLAIVAPDLRPVRDKLIWLLEAVFHPEYLHPAAAGYPRCYNVSLGDPLSEQPVVQAALTWLSLLSGRPKQEQSRLGEWLRSPYWSAGGTEADERALLDAAMRRELPYFTTLAAVSRLAQRLAVRDQRLCRQSMLDWEVALAEAASLGKSKQLPGAWSASLKRLLRAIGWPGERPLSSHEFQARQAFLVAVDGLGCDDAVLGRVSFAEIVRHLQAHCQQRVFQPETRGQPAIQILGVLESAGLQFDGIWVMGLNDDVWPPVPRPNPLLPAERLRAAGAPHASAEVELDFARRVQSRLLTAAPAVCLSYARADGSRILRPSPLLADLPAGEAAPRDWGLPDRAILDPTLIEEVDDTLAPPVQPGEKVRGGSWLLRAQAICPAWGFYQYRLGAQAMEEPVEGLDPAARGTLVHAALQAVWQTLQDSTGLQALSEASLSETIQAAAETAIAQFEAVQHHPLPARFRGLESGRLQRLLAVWLAFEKSRPEPFTVLACEEAVEVTVEGIRVRMVVDRIDALPGGRRLIIDYKTGASIDITNWAGERLTEPQLPIYAALAAVDEVAGVVFAKVLLDKPAFAGVADMPDVLPGVQGLGGEKNKIFSAEQFPDWASLRQHWQSCLTAVAREVQQGVAAVRITDLADLKYCEVLPLLRLPERARWLARQQGGLDAE